jgi:hypothetical protein
MLMKIVIDIDDNLYTRLFDNGVDNYDDAVDMARAIRKGTPLPKGHGAIKDVSQIEIPMCEDRTYERWVQVAINSAPTIIEADRGER